VQEILSIVIASKLARLLDASLPQSAVEDRTEDVEKVQISPRKAEIDVFSLPCFHPTVPEEASPDVLCMEFLAQAFFNGLEEGVKRDTRACSECI
jgi:hypothetical protein